MSKSRNRKRNAKPPAPAATGRRFPRPAAVVLTLAVLAAGGFWWSQRRHADTQPAVAPVATPDTRNQPSLAVTPNPGFEKLKGKWQRPDGGYILEIRSATAEGNLEAGYFNPRPINVAKAVASQAGETVRVFVELRDMNYPGSTYTLAYDPATDRLVGNYFQAVLGQNFDVEFVRQK